MRKYRILICFIILSGILLIGKSNPLEKLNSNYNFLYEGAQKTDRFLVCIDPGHQQKGNPQLEPIAPSSSSKKAKVSSGTAGVATKKAEYVLNLEASSILKEILLQRNYEVFMTRESHEVDISNSQRAMLANERNSNMVVKIHADSLTDSSKTGASILIPAQKSKYTSSIYQESYECAKLIAQKMKENNIKVNGIFERNDLTGFNWSKVPVVLVEMGFMSNYNEDIMMSNPNYQRKMMNCIADGIDEYVNTKTKGGDSTKQE